MTDPDPGGASPGPRAPEGEDEAEAASGYARSGDVRSGDMRSGDTGSGDTGSGDRGSGDSGDTGPAAGGPAPPAPPDAGRPTASLTFHLGLAAGVVPMFSAPALWLAGLYNRTLPDTPAQRLWTRRVFYLALIDTLVAATAIFVTVTGMQEVLQTPSPGPRIGVLLEADDSLQIREVLSGSPAEDAGLQAGDVIVSVDAEPVRDRDQMLAQLQAGRSTELTVHRGEQVHAVELTPATDLPAPVPSAADTERCGPGPEVRSIGSPWRLLPYASFLLLAAALWIVGRRRGVPQASTWIPLFVVFLLASLAGALGSWWACLLAGYSPRAAALGLLLAEIGLVALASAWLLVARRRGLVVEIERGEAFARARTYGLGVFYTATWTIRVMILSVPLVWASQRFGVGEVSAELTELLGGGARDPVQAALVFVSAALLAPVAEELLFRGLLLPHLARSLSPWPAIVLTAILFGLLHVAHGVMLVGPLTIGIVLGWARWRSRSLLVPIALHATINATASLLSFSGG